MAGHSPAWPARATGASTITTDLNAARVSIALVAGDEVECTFTNTLRPPAGQLFIRKITSGGVGVFDFDVFPPDDGEKLEARARTEEEEVPAEAEPSPLTVSPGLYRVEERLPKSDEGKWRLDSAYCNAKPEKVKRRLRGKPRLNSVEVEIKDQTRCDLHLRERVHSRRRDRHRQDHGRRHRHRRLHHRAV